MEIVEKLGKLINPIKQVLILVFLHTQILGQILKRKILKRNNLSPEENLFPQLFPFKIDIQDQKLGKENLEKYL